VSVQAEAPPVAVRDDRPEAIPYSVNTAARDPRAAGGRDHQRTLLDDAREIAWDFWHGRDLLYQLTLRDIRIRYKQAVMGFGWSIFMPIMIICSGALVRLAMARVSGSDLDVADVAGLAVKALPWAFFVGTIGFATASLTSNLQLVAKVYFPREVLPLSATFAQCFDTFIGLCALAVLLPFLGVRPSLALLWVPVLLALLVLVTAAMALFLSCANLFFRDVKYIVQVMLTFGIFFTPVFFEPAMLGPRGARLVMLNPLSPILEGLRLAVVRQHNLLEPMAAAANGAVVWEPHYLAVSALWAVGGFVLASLLFHRSEFVFAEYV
jgi:ABC-type polysaccharide/polyol phosphate export permease